MGINEIEILGVKDKNLLAKYSNFYHYFFFILMILFFSVCVASIVLLFFDVENYSFLASKVGLLVIGLLFFIFILVLFILNFKAVKQVKNCLRDNDYLALFDLLQPVDKKQKSEFLSLYAAAAALGDLHYKEAIQQLTSVLLSEDQVSWGRRRAIAHALAKIGTIKSVQALFQAYYLYSNPKRSMHMRSRFEFFHIFRTKRKVKILLSTIAKINHFKDLAELNANFGLFSNDF
ncbi:MAG: HEAT repeat domain-containing protein [Candidatus Heimdallarchaeota archaeon]|nr:HEAT repeat domain-containing protein [Candidatus Heimdallarchaeota archaeon]